MLKLPKSLLYVAASCATLAAGSAFAQAAPASPHTFTGKVALYSEYEYRGISQTSEKPALQLNLDYGHASGFYIGTFLTNIKWLEDFAEVGGFDTDAKLEWDIYGGYRFEVAKDTVVDVGYLRYEYPSSGSFSPKPNTDEIYAGLTFGPVNVKYSHSIGDETFGIGNSKNSYYLEGNLSWAIPGVNGLSLTGHLGHQEFKNNDALSYTVWKAGVLYDFGNGLNVGAYAKGTDARSDLYTYKGKDWSKDRLVAFVTYSF